MAAWKKYRFGDFLRRVKLPITIQDSESYKRVTIKTAHGGVSVRDYEVGKKIGTKKQFLLKEGLFVMSKIDARHGAFGIAGNDVDGAIITGNFWAYEFDKEVISIDWLNNFTNSPVFYDICERSSSGITHRKYLDEKKFLNNEIWLPSIGEQYRIIDSFKQRQEIFRSVRSELTHQQTLLKKLRQQILQEAIEGKLTANWRAQNPDVEPASELLKRIAAEKAQLVKDKKIKAQKPLPPISEEEKPFELPPSWEWCRLGDYAFFERGKFSVRPRNDPSCFGGEYPFIQIGSLDEVGSIVNSFRQTLNDKGFSASKNFEKGTIAVAIVGGTIGNIGVLGRDMCFPDSMVGVRPTAIKNQDYILALLRYFQPAIKRAAYQMAGQPNIKLPTLNHLVCGLPSIEEQAEILLRVNRILKYCDQLEIQITQNQTHAEQLMQAVLKEAFSHNSEAAPSAKKGKTSADTPEVAGA